MLLLPTLYERLCYIFYSSVGHDRHSTYHHLETPVPSNTAYSFCNEDDSPAPAGTRRTLSSIGKARTISPHELISFLLGRLAPRCIAVRTEPSLASQLMDPGQVSPRNLPQETTAAKFENL